MSFADINRGKSQGNSAIGADAQSSSDKDEIVGALNVLTSLTYSIRTQENLLGTNRDTPESRAETQQQINKCVNLYNEIQTKLTEMRPNNDIESFYRDKSVAELSTVHQSYQDAVRSYNNKMNSPSVKDTYERKIAEYSIKSTTPLIDPSKRSTKYVPEEVLDSERQLQTQLQMKHPQLATGTIDFHNELIQQRDQAIKSVSQGVSDINKIFKDLDSMVIQQGEQVDSIENNIQQFSSNAKLANTELVKADNYQKSKRKCTCIFFMVLIVVFMIFLALIS